MTIVEQLVSEHRTVETLLDAVEQEVPALSSAEEAKRIARLFNSILKRHGDIEREIAYLALDHALAEHEEVTRLNQEHDELDSHIQGVLAAATQQAAVTALKDFITGARSHFKYEEKTLFPKLAKVLPEESLKALSTIGQSR